MNKNLSPERREKAWRFVEFALSKEAQSRLARLGRALPSGVDGQQEFVAGDPQRRKPFIDALSYSLVQPLPARSDSCDRAIVRHFQEAIDPKRAFDAQAMLESLAQDPDLIGAFPQPTHIAP